MPQLDLGSVLGPQGPKGDPGNQGTVGPRGPQGEQGDAGKDATINGVNALTIETGDGLEATMTGSTYNLKLTDNTLNAARVVPTFTRPNLLDNWYFGSPVDQRGGYVVPPGMAYKDVNTGVTVGTTTTYYTVTQFSNGNAIITVDGLNRFVQPGGFVRGYTGNGYTVDRWITDGKPVTIGSGIGVEAVSFLYQKLEQSTMDALHGKLITFSALTTSNGFLTGSWVVDNANQSDTRIAENDEFILFRSPWTGNGWGIYSKTAMHILAAKLELGPTQTLAHRDAAGNWVLNEVPEYGEQLRRCQRYCVDITPSLIFNTMYSGFLSTTGCDFLVPIPVTLRESGSAPVVICNPAEWQVAVVAANAYFTPTSISVSQTASGAIMLRCLFSNSLPGQYCDLRKAVDSAKLILSKDL